MSHLSPESIAALLDGEADPAAAAHLAACPACRAELAATSALYAELAALPDEPLDVDLAPAVLARIAPPPLPRPYWALLAAQIAACAALAIWLVPLIAAGALGAGASLRAGLAAPDWAGLAAQADAARAGLGQLASAADALGRGPLGAVAPLEWAGLLGAAGLLWLAGNRYLLWLADAADHTREVRP